MVRTTGTVHGNMIEVAQPLGLPDGQQVELVVRVACMPEVASDEFGPTADYWSAEDDRILAEIADARFASDFRDASP